MNVTQAARDAAADYGKATHAVSTLERLAIRRGEWDDLPRVTKMAAILEQARAEAIEQAAGVDVASIWRNAITNTVLLIDIARKRHPVASRNKAYAAFDRELNDLVEKWFSFSRGVSPKTYSEAEAEWQRFEATAIRSLSAAQAG
jgi:hypothetical protein